MRPPPATSIAPSPRPKRPKPWPRRRSPRPRNNKPPGRRALFVDEESARLDRRNFLRWLGVAAASGVTPLVALAADDDLYDVGRFANVRILHLPDTHAQLQPVHFREPSVNIGVAAMRGQPPH